MKTINSGISTLPLVQCINERTAKHLVLWDCEEVHNESEEQQGSTYRYKAEEFDHKPTLDEVKEIILKSHNDEIDQKILSGFVWNEMPIWLSKENQFNYKAGYDLAVQTDGASLPVTFKFGTTDNPVYYTFEDLATLKDFFMKAMTYINTTLEAGWQEKDAIDWTPYENILEP